MSTEVIILSIAGPIVAGLLGTLGWIAKRHLDQGKRLAILETKVTAHENLCEGRWGAQSRETHEVHETLNRIETKVDTTQGTLATHVADEDQKFDMLITLVRKQNGDK